MGIDLDQARHLFLSPNGILLDSWRQAFPDAVCHAEPGAIVFEENPAVLWLRLTSRATVAQQIGAVRLRFGSLPLIVMSDIPNDLEALAAFSVAARGYCNTHAGAEVLRNVASVVAQGGLWIGESIMLRLLATPLVEPVASAIGAGGQQSWATELTEREREVAKAVAQGESNRDIAVQLGITERTIKAHVGAVLNKLKIKSRLQLALLVKNS